MYVTTGRDFDERRNTSRTFRPAPGALERALDAARSYGQTPEGAWIGKRARGEHDHGARRKDGSRASCPVWGCRVVEDGMKRA